MPLEDIGVWSVNWDPVFDLRAERSGPLPRGAHDSFSMASVWRIT
jgi:hypothetical protein